MDVLQSAGEVLRDGLAPGVMPGSRNVRDAA